MKKLIKKLLNINWQKSVEIRIKKQKEMSKQRLGNKYGLFY